MKVQVTSTESGVGQLFAAPARSYRSIAIVLITLLDALKDDVVACVDFLSSAHSLVAMGDAEVVELSQLSVTGSPVSPSASGDNYRAFSSTKAENATSRYDWTTPYTAATLLGASAAATLGEPMSLQEFIGALESAGQCERIIVDQVNGLVFAFEAASGVDLSDVYPNGMTQIPLATFSATGGSKWE
jgi:hypothetical protein